MYAGSVFPQKNAIFNISRFYGYLATSWHQVGMHGNMKINVEHKTFIEVNSLRKGKIHQQTTKLETSIQNLCRLPEMPQNFIQN